MANKRIFQLDAVTLADTFTIPVDDASLSETGSTTIQELQKFFVLSLYDTAPGSTYTWPLAADYTGLNFTLKCTYDGVCAVTMQGAETMDSGTSFDLIELESITALSDGTNWLII